jgi:integrase
MAWKEIDLDRMIWDIPASKTKNKKPAIIALPPPAVAILQSRWALSNGSPYVFPSNGSSGHAIDPRKAWDRVRAGMRQCPQCGQRAGGKPTQCPKCGELVAFQQNKCHRCGENVKEPVVCRECNHALPDAKSVNLRMHDLRRSLGSWQATAGASLAIIGASLGHADLKSTQVYARLQLDTIRQSVDSAAAAMLTAGGQTKLLEINSTLHTQGGSD